MECCVQFGPPLQKGCGQIGPMEAKLKKKLGCLVKYMKIKSLEEIYPFSLPIKESEIINFFLGCSLKDEVLNIMPVQKHTQANQHTRFKAFVATVTTMGTSVLVSSAPRKLLLLFVGQSPD
uniref:Uncharacterized protein n=1 Tax=Crocodylus porosus TaxID=8502 RepID=A0A7M4FN85_CROPO